MREGALLSAAIRLAFSMRARRNNPRTRFQNCDVCVRLAVQADATQGKADVGRKYCRGKSKGIPQTILTFQMLLHTKAETGI